MDDATNPSADAAPAVVADYLVHTPAGQITVPEIATIDVCDHGTLTLLDVAGGVVALFAAGRWTYAYVVDPAAAETG